MKTRSLAIVIAAALILAPGASRAATWKADNAHSSIGFTVRHLGISKVNGTFGDFSGELMFDEGNLTEGSASVTIQAASLDTKNDKRNEDLMKPVFFDTENYPMITFRSDKVEKTDEGYVLRGKLKIRDIEKEVAIPFQFLGSAQSPWGDTRAGFEGNLTITREEFNVGWSDVKYHPPLISNDVVITLDLEVVRQE